MGLVYLYLHFTYIFRIEKILVFHVGKYEKIVPWIFVGYGLGPNLPTFLMLDCCPRNSCLMKGNLDGGNSNIFGIFTPKPWGFMIQFDDLICFSIGLVQPPLFLIWGFLGIILEFSNHWALNHQLTISSKKSPTGPTERTPKPEYLVALPTYLGVCW